MNNGAYLNHPGHAGWRSHYSAGHNGPGLLLGFTQEWRDEFLPRGVGSGPGYDNKALLVKLLDTQDGKVYDTWLPAAYNDAAEIMMLDADWNPVPAWTLLSYFYFHHHCPCHRKCDAKDLGADTDEECEGDRFLIQSITCENFPKLVLYSETIGEEELEELLKG